MPLFVSGIIIVQKIQELVEIHYWNYEAALARLLGKGTTRRYQLLHFLSAMIH